MNDEGLKLLAEVRNGDRVTITKTKNQYKTPSFQKIGGEMSYSTKIKGFCNLYSLLQDLSKQSTWFWWGLLKVRDLDTNICVFEAKDHLEAKKITIAYKELNLLGLIKRVSKQHYMINPKAFIPNAEVYDKVQAKWNSLP